MPEPVFNQEDRVPPNAPPNPTQVAPPATRVVSAPPPKDKTAFWNDPDKATREVVREEANKIVTELQNNPANAAALETQLQQAKYVMKQKYGDKFTKFEEEIEKIVRQTPAQGVAIGYWETVFNFVRGKAFDKEVEAAEQRARMPAEPVSAAASAPPKPVTINQTVDREAGKSEAQVADGLGLSPEAYLKGRENMENNKFPLTMDNRRRRSA